MVDFQRTRLTVLFSIGCFWWPTFGANNAVQVHDNGKRAAITIKGRISAGESFSRNFGPNFVFELRPEGHASGVWLGWDISIRQPERDINLAGMTPPWRGPGPLGILGWNLLPGRNAPHEFRNFMFSTEVGKSITWDMVDPRDRPEDYVQTKALLARIEQFGRGEFRITPYELIPAADESRTGIKWMEFEVQLSWPASYKP